LKQPSPSLENRHIKLGMQNAAKLKADPSNFDYVRLCIKSLIFRRVSLYNYVF
jgi:hypothetical protein